MSDLKAYLASYKSFMCKMLPIVPDDNAFAEESTSLVIKHNTECLEKLLRNNKLVFISELVNNASIHQFMESYLQSRSKPLSEGSVSVDYYMDRLVFMIFLRLFSATEVDQLGELLPNINISVQAAKGKPDAKQDGTSDPAEKRLRLLRDQYTSYASSVPFAKVPCAMDIIAIIGDSNSALGGKLLQSMCAMKPSSGKEIADAIKESLKALDQVHQSFIVLSRRILDAKHSKGSGKSSGTKVSGLSVLSLERKSSGQEKASKLSAAEELLFLCEFAADIVYTLQATLSAIQHAQLPQEVSNILCLDGTHLTGKQGLPLLRAMQNLYEVVLPIAARCVAQESAVKGGRAGELLSVLQAKALQILHGQLSASVACITSLCGADPSVGKSVSDLFDSMDVLREDAIDWMAFLNGHDPLGRDPLVLTASTANAGESGSSKILNATATAQAKTTVTTAGVVHTVEESEVLRGAFLTDYVKVYGVAPVEYLVRCSLGREADSERVSYVLSSLQGAESLLEMPSAQLPALPVVAEMGASSGASASPASVQPNLTEMISNIKVIFPELGEGFIEACIAAYKGNMEELIDALLTNNLQPKLLVLDRSLQKVWIGKGGNASKETVSLDAKSRDARVVYKAVEDEAFKQVQLERVRKMEAQQAFDHMLLSREYNDDYDDQYDDQIADPLKVEVYGGNDAAKHAHNSQEHKPTQHVPAAAPAPVILNRRERRKMKDQPGAVAVSVVKPPASSTLTTAMIHQQMAEMKRLNTLTKDAEVEDAYWESMKNTNRVGAAHSGKGSWKAELLRQEQEELAAQEQQRSAALPPRPPTAGASSAAAPAAAGGARSGGKATGDAPGKGVPKPVAPATAAGGAQQQGKGKKQTQQQPAGSGNAKAEADGDAGGEGAGTGDAAKKHRTKPYDKHHQKDRSTRKFSHFAPQT